MEEAVEKSGQAQIRLSSANMEVDFKQLVEEYYEEQESVGRGLVRMELQGRGDGSAERQHS